MAAKIHCKAYSGLYLYLGGSPRRDQVPPIGSGIFRNEDSVFAKSYCGIASWRCIFSPDPHDWSLADYREGTTIPYSEFRCLPAQAQCGVCLRRIEASIAKHEPLGLNGIGSSLIPPRSATEESILSVEAFLHWLVRLFERDFPELEEIPLYSYCG